MINIGVISKLCPCVVQLDPPHCGATIVFVYRFICGGLCHMIQHQSQVLFNTWFMTDAGDIFIILGIPSIVVCMSISYLKLSMYLQLPYGLLYRLVLSDNSANMLRQVPFVVFLCNSWSIALLIPLYWFSVYKIVSYNIRFCIHLLSIGYSVYWTCTLNAEAHR